ncbi:hypothetical protein DSM104329_02508 [Capillimicrobium parvum]|uniref:Apea-like HEPN domain-containing protein n=2 Tax=Capillimicrobium parvum TaxID=2884022 RepID=A0A9E6XXD5_9ACTN|nr:hypothetical protein DSM104329_02508 [Capillimicrobium parvum]
MPWLRIGDPVQLGPVLFFDYPADDLPVTLSTVDRDRLDRVKRAYLTWPEQDEVRSIVVATIDSSFSLRPLTDDERTLVRRAGYALAFSSLAFGYHNPVLPCSSDNFLLYHQMLDGSGGIAVQSGRKLTGFGDGVKMKFVCPPWTPTSLVPTRPDNDFVTSLGLLISRDDAAELRRLWLALESFFYALTDNEMYKGLWRLVHLNIALEALLDFANRREFVARIGKWVDPYSRGAETVSLFNGPGQYTLAQQWASDFYNVRNALVHGHIDTPADTLLFWRGVRPHAEIAVRVFRMCVREILATYVRGPASYGGQPVRIGDIDFDDWILDNDDPDVVERRPGG